jgi:AraC-like DNA-binding protein
MERLGVIAEHCAVFTGRRVPTAAHRHHAVEINVCLPGSAIDLAIARGEALATGAGYVVDADVSHRITRTAGGMLIVYVDPELVEQSGAEAVRELPAEAAARAAERLAEWRRAGYPEGHARSAVDGLLAALPISLRRPRLDRRVARARERFRDDAAAARVDDVARELGVSRGHLADLFRRDLGTTMRAWRKWHRLCAGLVAAFEGQSVTEAAHAAGFADGAHMTRTCREMFGVPPSRFIRLDRIVVVRAAGTG